MAHGFAYFSTSALLSLHVVAGSLIAFSCYLIAALFFWSARKRRGASLGWAVVFFGAFLAACGSVFLVQLWSGSRRTAWMESTIELVAAVSSVPAAILLTRIFQAAFQLPEMAPSPSADALAEANVAGDVRGTELDPNVGELSYPKLAEFLDLTHDAMIVHNLERKITYWNRAAVRLYGWEADEVRGRSSNEVLQTQFPKPLSEIEADVLEKGSWEGELTHRRRDGLEIIASSRWTLRRDENGKPEAILESNRDITQRIREGQKFRDLLESAPDAIVIVDKDGCIQLVNAQSEKLFGYSRAELMGQAVEVLMPNRFRASHVRHRELYARSPHGRAMGVGLELFGRRKDGSEFPIEVSLSPLATAGGTLVSSAIRDVTDRRRAEESIRRLNAELSQKVAEISAANAELETFSYSVSHDLRAPLRHIDGFARILQEDYAPELSEDGRHYLDRILGAVNHMGHLVDDLLNLARIGRTGMARQRVNLQEVVRQVLAELPEEEQKREIEWRIEPLPEVDGDPGLLKLVFSNLLANAAKFTRTRQPAVIEVGMDGPSEAPVFFVRDNGVGFDPQYADKLFGVFQRLHRQEDFEGTGIGLATVQRIIRRHGGDIRAEAALDRGATFLFTLQPPHQDAAGGAREIKIGRSYEH